MRRTLFAAAALTALLAGAVAIAQPKSGAQAPQQVVTPPKATYWLSATTGSGLMGLASSAPQGRVGMMEGMRMARQMMSGGGVSHQLELDLGSTLPPTGAPQASHTGPAGLGVRGALPLETPKIENRPAERQETRPGEPQRPKGRLLLFWGCGERARAGQPVVIDFARMAQGQMPPGLASLTAATVNAGRPPGPENSRTYGRWPSSLRPNGDAQIPATGSLLGAHALRGSYTPDINFTATQDFLAPVTFTTNARASSGAVNLAWTAVPGATAYAGWTFGAKGDDLVFWSSSDAKTFGAFESFIPPGEAARLVRERVLLAPTTTQCTVPADAMEAMGAAQGPTPGQNGAGPNGGAGVLFFTAWGPEQTVIYPERPADPRTPWNQEWAVKLRTRSASMQMLGQSLGGAMTQAGQAGQQGPACPPPGGPSMGEMIGGATGIPGAGMLGGALSKMGKKKQDQPAPPPGCPR